MKLFHITTKSSAELISKTGFRDGMGNYGIYDQKKQRPKYIKGVFLADEVVPYLTKEEGETDSVFVLDIPEKVILEFEIIEKRKGYREWCIPSKLVNKYFTDRFVYSIDNENLYKKPRNQIKLDRLDKKLTEEEIKKLLGK